MTTPKTGALTFEDLREIWRGAVDESYSEPLERAGDGHGIEAFSQMWEVYERVSRAVDVTTQAMFILPWSGQTNPPSQGEAKATVTLTFQRTRLAEWPLRLAAGTIYVAHQVVDWGVDGGVDVLTGLRFVLLEDLVFNPGELGPFTVQAIAEKPGYSYNDPLPDTLINIPQVGGNFENDLASMSVVGPLALVSPSVASATVQAANQADMFVPEHVGQQVILVGGSNAGKVARIKNFYPPQPDLSLGSRVDLEIAQAVEGDTFVGTFIDGEDVTFDNAGPVFAEGRVFSTRVQGGVQVMTYDVFRGDFSLVTPGTTVITGIVSGATMTVRTRLRSELFVAETATAEWRILSWAGDWGLTVTNVTSPSGGRAGWLDELGAERNIHRAPGEGDDTYRKRVATPADVVTPNAVRRALTRALGAFPWCFREVGTDLLPGWFFDFDAFDYDSFQLPGALLSGVFDPNERVVLEQYDTGPLLVKTVGYFGKIAGGFFTFVRVSNQPPSIIAPATHRVRGLSSGAIFDVTGSPVISVSVVNNRFRVLLDYASFRAYFLVGLPRLGIGEIGFAYDAGPMNAFDAPVVFDGFPAGARVVYARTRQAIDETRAGGVGFDLYLTDEACEVPPALPGAGP